MQKVLILLFLVSLVACDKVGTEETWEMTDSQTEQFKEMYSACQNVIQPLSHMRSAIVDIANPSKEVQKDYINKYNQAATCVDRLNEKYLSWQKTAGVTKLEWWYLHKDDEDDSISLLTDKGNIVPIFESDPE